MRSVRSLLIVTMLVVVLFSSVSATYAQPPVGNCRYFVETGHYVCDEFLEFYDKRGKSEIFGFPLTEAFKDHALGLQVQYFQRARMEWHPNNPAPYRVQLGLLVDELGYRFPSARSDQIPSSNNDTRHYFSETGHVVSYAFLKYFREKGGVDIFGYPRSEFMYEDGYVVQYFQRARMEWHPEFVSGPQMRLTNLGETYLERFPVSQEDISSSASQSGFPESVPQEYRVTDLHVSASVRYAITGRQGVQTVFVYVNDQQDKPVQGADVKMVIHYQSGDQSYEFNPTNASGFTRYGFDLSPSLPGQKVVIDVTVTHGDSTATTQTFFLPWW
ncbi:MAG: hypothetical protein SWK90_17150 [Chloroflexota bacterium]|nr:hypothetical protein [Chloroflexota bacterium]